MTSSPPKLPLEIEEIKRILPHRYPFLMVDRILEFEADKRLVALKSVSAETTFDSDLSDAGALADTLWPLCERVAARLRHGEVAAHTVVLKLKTADFRIITRRCRSSNETSSPSQSRIVCRVSRRFRVSGPPAGCL